MQLGVFIPGMLPGAELASLWLSFSAKHSWCSVGHMGLHLGQMSTELLHC